MKKEFAIILALMLLLSAALAETPDYSQVSAKDCENSYPLYGLALMELPEEAAALGEAYYYGPITADTETGIIVFYDAVLLYDGDNISAAVLTSLGVIGMEGDIDEAAAANVLKTFTGESGKVQEITRLDGHNAYITECSVMLVGEDSPELQAETEGVQKAHEELYRNFVNIPISTAPEVGKVLSFVATDLDGKAYNSAELFAGADRTMLNLWAVWCSPCVSELEELQRLNDETEGLQVVLICCDLSSLEDTETIAEAKAILAEKGVKLLCLAGVTGLENLFMPDCYPTSHLVDREGVVLCEPKKGSDSLEEYQSWIEKSK